MSNGRSIAHAILSRIMDIFISILLGVVQGITEFLPVSSTGHLIIFHSIFGTGDTHGLAFDAVLHLATATAVVLYFWKDIWVLFQTLLRTMGRMPVNQKDQVLLMALIGGTIPAVILGVMLESLMESVFRAPLLVAGVLVLGSLLFIYAEYMYKERGRSIETLSLKKGFFIGLFQSLALIPGMSRSGASIAGGMILGLTRVEAARFAFLLAVPLLLGAGMKKLLELLNGGGEISIGVLIAGSVTAFVVGLSAIHFMLSFVRKHTLWPFIIYRLVLALLISVFIFLG